MWRILIVDDVESTRALLSGILKHVAECLCVCDGQEAVEEFAHALEQGRPFDCILLDFEMPRLNGLQFLEEIRKAEGELARVSRRGRLGPPPRRRAR